MRNLATPLRRWAAVALLAAGLPLLAQAQDVPEVTIRQLNALPQEAIDQLMALGPEATVDDIRPLVTNEFVGRTVRIRAVVLSNPRNSGLSGLTGGIPTRVHFFVRDVAAAEQGPDGMGIQVVDATRSGVSLQFDVGDIIEITGRVQPFLGAGGVSWQFEPLDGDAMEIVDAILDPDDPLLQPVTVTVDEINRVVQETPDGAFVRINWANYNRLVGQYVRIENAVVTNSTVGTRPNYAVASPGSEARIAGYDVSLRFRNDRTQAQYPNPPFTTRPPDDPFVPPPPGSVVNLQGFLVYQGTNPYGFGQPGGTIFTIAPMEDRDLEVTVSPPIVGVDALAAVPTGPFEVRTTAQVTGEEPLTTLEVRFEVLDEDGETLRTGTVGMSPIEGENRFAATVPIAEDEDGAFVRFRVRAVDGAGRETISPPTVTRVLADGITRIEQIQRTLGGVQGASPFAGITTDMNVEAVVMTSPGISGLLSVQDDPDLNPWTGIFLVPTAQFEAQLERGDRVRITRAQIEEFFGLTRLNQVQLERLGEGEPYDHLVITTDQLAQSSAVAESYEGMALRFENVTITAANADAPSNFGEFAFSSSTAQNQVRARTGVAQASRVLPNGTTLFEGGEELTFLQGIWTFSFSNFKLLPERGEDFGGFAVSAEPETAPVAFALEGAYPNPIRGRATVTYHLDQPGHVRLEVFDVLGRRAAVLVDEVQAPGAQVTTFDASGLAAGVYVLRLAAGDAVATRRVTVVR